MSDGDPSRLNSTARWVNQPLASLPTPPPPSPTQPTTVSPSSLSVATPLSLPSLPSTRTTLKNQNTARQDVRSGYTRETPLQVSSPNCLPPLNPSPAWNRLLHGDRAGTSYPPLSDTATLAAGKVDRADGMSPCSKEMDCDMADSN